MIVQRLSSYASIVRRYEVSYDRFLASLTFLVGLCLGPTQFLLGTDDTAYYWLTGKAITNGTYLVIRIPDQYVQLGMNDLFIRQPFYPVLMWVSSLLVGETVATAFLSIVVAAVAFPVVCYSMLRRLEVAPFRAFLVSMVLYLLPGYQLRSLSSALPNAIYAVLFVLACYFAFRLLDESDWRTQACFGIVGGLAILTRPEALFYVGSLGLIVTFEHRRLPYLSALLQGVCALIWSAISWVTVGTVWYSNYEPSAYSLSNTRELAGIVWHNLDRFIETFTFSVPAAVVLLVVIAGLVFAGTRRAAQDRPVLLLLCLPVAVHTTILLTLPPKAVYTFTPGGFVQQFSATYPVIAIFAALGLERIATARPLAGRASTYLLEAQSALWLLYLYDPRRTTIKWKPKPGSLWQLLAKPFPYFDPSDYAYVNGFPSPKMGSASAYVPWRSAMYDFYLANPPVINEGAVLVAAAIVVGGYLFQEYSRSSEGEDFGE